MSLLTTLNTIETNLETILTTTLGYSLEDLSVDDIEETPLAQLITGDMDILDDEKLSIEYADRIYGITVKAQVADSTPDLGRAKANDLIAALRGAITESALNSGDLEVSRLVVSITGFRFPQFGQEGKIITQDCGFTINFNAE